MTFAQQRTHSAQEGGTRITNALETGATLSRYEILAPLGAGGMGEVYRAADRSLGRTIALKVIRQGIVTEAMRRRFVREARAASALNHPNIVSVYDVGEVVSGETRVDFMAMELIEGETYRSFLSRSFDLSRALLYLAQVADGLAKAHSAGIVHRDLKPENVMISVDGFCKILDFGLARSSLLETEDVQTSAAATLSFPGTVAGTVGYMAPEQVRSMEVDHRADIFSLGCMLYETVTRRRPFEGRNAVEVLQQIASGKPAPIGDVDPPVSNTLRRIIFKCLAPAPEDRYQSARDVALDLRDSAREYEGVPVRPRFRQVRRLLLIWGLAVVLVTVAGFLASRSTEVRQPVTAAPSRFDTMTIQRLAGTEDALSGALSPDGRYVAYVQSSVKGEAIFLRQIATGSDIEIAPPDGLPYTEVSFSADGDYIRYVHDGALRQRPSLGGDARVLIDHVQDSIRDAGITDVGPALQGAQGVTFSPDGERCAYIRDGSVYVASSDGSGETRIATAGSSDRYLRAVWSPRGDVIACIRRSSLKIDRGETWIEIFDVRRASPTDPAILGNRWYVIESLAWLPDGNALAFTATMRPMVDRQIYQVSYPQGRTARITNDLFDYAGVSVGAGGKILLSRQTDRRSSVWIVPRSDPAKATRVLTGVGLVQHVAAHPDGGFVYAATSGGNGDIWRCSRDCSRRVQLTDAPGDDLIPDVSPDGRTVAFVSDRTGQTAVWLVSADGGRQSQLTFEGVARNPRFSPDGKSILYMQRESRQPELRLIPVSGGPSSPVPGRFARKAEISPDGRFIAGASEELDVGITVAAGGSIVRQFAMKLTGMDVRWTRDSRAVAIPNGGAIYLQPIAGGPATPIVDFSPDQIQSFDWTADGSSLIVARTAQFRGLVAIENFH